MIGLPNLFNSKKMSSKDMAIITQSLSYMLAAGMTMRTGVTVIMDDPNCRVNKFGLRILIDAFDDGLSLSQALHKHEKVFGTGLWRQVESAERTGKLRDCLIRLSNQLKGDQDLVKKIKGALTYPIFVLIAAFIAAYYMFTVTVPEMENMIVEFGGELPALTVFIMGVCDLLLEHGLLIGLILILFTVVVIWALNYPFRFQWHRWITKMPIAGQVSIDLNYSRVYLMINDMIENGAHAVEALKVAANSSSNTFISHELLVCASNMESEGNSLSSSLQLATSMPVDDKLMLEVGRKTGREDEILKELSKKRSDAAEASVEQLIVMLNPIAMMIVGAIVGVVIIAVYAPTLAMSTVLL